jgi:DNA-binding MarR family transcriptional regulator
MEQEASSFTELEDTLGALLRAPYRRLQQAMYGRLAEQFPEIRRAHSAVFRHLSPEGVRLTDLAEQAEMTKQSMSYLVGHLEEHGYVRTVKHPTDGRATLVQPTAKGDRFVEAALGLSRQWEARAAKHLGEEGVRQLRQLLKDLDGVLAAEAPA